MIKYKVKRGEPVLFGLEEEVEITEYLLKRVLDDKIFIYAYNICMDHVHLILKCKNSERDLIIKNFKGGSTFLYKTNHKIKETLCLWAQKYTYIEIKTKDHFIKAEKYIKNNRKKHHLPVNEKLIPLIEKMILRI